MLLGGRFGASWGLWGHLTTYTYVRIRTYPYVYQSRGDRGSPPCRTPISFSHCARSFSNILQTAPGAASHTITPRASRGTPYLSWRLCRRWRKTLFRKSKSASPPGGTRRRSYVLLHCRPMEEEEEEEEEEPSPSSNVVATFSAGLPGLLLWGGGVVFTLGREWRMRSW